MKKTILTIVWMIAFFAVGLTIFGIFITKFAYLPPNPDPNSPQVQQEVMRAGLVSSAFVFGLPIFAMILGIIGVLPGTRRRKMQPN